MGSVSNIKAFSDWTCYMKAGEFEKAWAVSDDIMRSTPAESTRQEPRHLQRVWNGEDLAGKRVLVRCNHGLGDTIQFARYLPLVARVAERLELETQPSLKNLLGSMECCDHIFDLDNATDAAFDVEIEIMELQHAFRTTLDTIPDAVPYFSRYQRHRDADEAIHVGLVWRAGDWDERRSIPFRELQQLFDVKGIECHILQQSAAAAGWIDGWGNLSVGENLEADAQTIADLDLMISVDTMTAHLAGAIGQQVWILLHSDADWRWLDGRQDSPWYPTMRLFRQSRPGDWTPAIDAVKNELVRRVHQAD